MKKLLTLLAMGLTLSLNAAHAAEPTAQQNKMGACNKDAGEKTLKGDERKAFMKECLSAKKESPKEAQQNKMKTCNKDAGEKTLKGDERKAFMKDCLSK